jgi:hypothetical protein
MSAALTLYDIHKALFMILCYFAQISTFIQGLAVPERTFEILTVVKFMKQFMQ